MCEANAYLKEGEDEILFMEAVDIIEPFEDGLKLVDIFGKQKFLRARIMDMTLLNHRILLEHVPIPAEAAHASSHS
ncbi:CooT family nickel-binding protein [Desulfitobacterium metallireducens]|uniref:RNA-binding protein n=1 Tax=Desulfitobacterium metallireducens DSM 15288 TaxID=871968 RepID=W0E638_9FIRM|nr:CooT family nickel-binding protein [Desulfitobacterium metallireducens]AHF06330.1 RNA-binding protein [Desulfitobacterium metallireducens DSM 15288]